jgi:hypothetical protein
MVRSAKEMCDSLTLNTLLGRSFAIVPYSQAKEGFIDIDEDDFQGGKEFLSTFQSAVIRLRGDGWN